MEKEKWCHICGKDEAKTVTVNFSKEKYGSSDNRETLRICSNCVDKFKKIFDEVK